MKINWGHGLLIAIVIGTGGILFLVYMAFRQNIDLVTEAYYPKELVYESQISKIKNTNSLVNKVLVTVYRDSLHITFPKVVDIPDNIKGEIWLYFPADKTKDKKYSIDLSDKLRQSFILSNIKKGKFEVLIDWEAQGTEYFQREIIYFQN